MLTVSFSFARVLVFELVAETMLVLCFALLLWGIAAYECARDADFCGNASFGAKLALSLSSVRLSTDSIFGWQARTPSTTAEVLVLVAEGWLHWLLLTIAGSVIVARALLPHKQLVFSHTAVIDTDKELVVRLTLVRHGVVLLQPSYRMQSLNTMGVYQDLPMKGIASGHAILPPTCLTIRHVIDADSPLHSSNEAKRCISAVLLSVTATDAASGAPVYAAISYINPDCPHPSISSQNVPKLSWGAKFMDMLDIAGDGTIMCNMDNLSRVVSNEASGASSTLSSAVARTSNAVAATISEAKVVPGGGDELV